MKKKMLLASYSGMEMLCMSPQRPREEELKLLALARMHNAELLIDHSVTEDRVNFSIWVNDENTPQSLKSDIKCELKAPSTRRRDLLLLGEAK